MNRWRKVQAGLAAVALSGAGSAVAQSLPDTWHGGGQDVIVLEPSIAEHGVEEMDPGARGEFPGVGWVNVLGYEFRGRSGPYQYGTSPITTAHWCEGSEEFADARIDIPHNATISFFRIWGLDGSADHDVTAYLFESCLPDISAGSHTNTVLQEISSTGTPGAFTVTSSPSAGPTDTRTCTYWVRVRFGGVGSNCAAGGTTSIRKARVQYAWTP